MPSSLKFCGSAASSGGADHPIPQASGSGVASEMPRHSSVGVLEPPLSRKDVALMLRCCERTIVRQVSAQRFPKPVKLGRQEFWSRRSIEEWLSGHLSSRGSGGAT